MRGPLFSRLQTLYPMLQNCAVLPVWAASHRASRESKLVRKARMVNPQLQNGTALVTGGGRGIGRSISEKLAKLGLTVVITGRDQNLLERTAEAIQSAGGKCRPLAFDITDLTSVTNAARYVQREFGGLRYPGE